MKTRIALFALPCFEIEDDALEMNLGLAYIAANLHKHGFEARVYECTGMNEDTFTHSLTCIAPADIYGISILSSTYTNAKKLVFAIRGLYPNAYIVAGGVHPSALPNATIAETGVDAVVVGEGEDTFVKIAETFANGERKKGIIQGVPPSDLNALPYPHRLPASESPFTRRINGQPVASLLSSRGCRYACLHCNSTIMGGGSNKVRFRSIENIIGEMKALRALGYSHFRFNDDSFTDRPNAESLIEAIGELGIVYRIFARLDSLNEERIRLLVQSGCAMVSIGLESVNPYNLAFLRKGKMPYEMLTVAKKHNLATRVSFMVGLPYDTYDSVRSDFTYVASLDFDEFAVYALIPYPGTPLWESPANYGYTIEKQDFSKYIQLGRQKKTAAVMSHISEDGYRFTLDDVTNWVTIANTILSRRKQHMKYSNVQ